MSPKQKRFIFALAVLNVVVISILVMLATKSSHLTNTRQSTVTPSPLLILATCSAMLGPEESWQATQLLAQTELGGTVTFLTNGTLQFEITYPIASSSVTTQTVDRAAQSIWTAFDIALDLLEKRTKSCIPFDQIDVTILVQDHQTKTRLNARVKTADLLAFSVDELSQDEFIDRVTYTVSHIDEP